MTEASQYPQLVRASWQRVEPAGDLIARRFYGLLFRDHPELRPLFPPSLRRLRRHVLQTVDTVVEHADDLDAAAGFIRDLGARHAFRAKPEHYPIVGDCLVGAVGYFDSEWGTETALAWTWAYDAVSGLMLEGAEDALTGSIDPRPRWYIVQAVEVVDSHGALWLTPEADPCPYTTAMWATPGGLPGLWQTVLPAPLTERGEPRPLDSISEGEALMAMRLDVELVDTATRALAFTWPGSRVAIAPEVHL